MAYVKISPKYQIVIPKQIREDMALRPGDRVQVLRYQDRLELVPLRRPSDLRGFLPGLDTTVEREGDRV
ncbi:MAG: AbrB/MazE/SpoVT family DNA-binding domain-containing protein [Thermodesulfobacteriota bacterium]